MRLDYTYALQIIQGNSAITRLPGGAMTPKRPLSESFKNLEGKIVAASYSTIVDLFYFFNGKGLLQIYGYD